MSEANLVLDRAVVTWSQVDITLPHAKRQRVAYHQKDCPHVSILVNNKVIKKHTLLVALEDKLVKAAVEKDKQDRVAAQAKAKAAAAAAACAAAKAKA